MSLAGKGKFGKPQITNWGRNAAPWFCPEILDDDAGVLKMHNTLTGRKDAFVPMKGREVRWYTCGPTVYDSSHVGHARTYLSLDIMRRIMTDYFHYHVVYQVNITDIDDKIILRARQNLLIDELKKEMSSDDSTLEALIQTSITEATQSIEKKQQKLEDDLAKATAENNSRSRTELEGLLDQHKLKRDNLQQAIKKIEAALKEEKTDSSALIDVASSVLAPKLDKEKGDSVTDHSVFLEHARKYELEFMEDMRALNIREPDVLTRVTEYIPQIIEFVDKLVKKEMAYVSPGGSVYLSLDAFQKAGHNYRKLSGGTNSATSEAEMAEGEGALASSGTQEKRNPNDFVLWKASKPGEPAWESPWGKGRPGWHIECSVVASDILGDVLDIHSGGEDLKFPHHDNELAQSEACMSCGGSMGAEGGQWVNYFTHTGHLHIEGLKMSKSLKNFITIRQALEKNSSRLLRLLFLLAGGWDQPMNYSQQTMDDARSKEKTFKSFFRQVETLSRNYAYYEKPVGWTSVNSEDHDLYQSLLDTQRTVHDSLLDNFNTKDAMLALLNVISDANAYLRDKANVPNPAVLTLKSIAVYVTQILKVFGVVTGNDDFGFESSDGGGENGATATNGSSSSNTAMIQTLVSFREQVRNQALAAVKNKDGGGKEAFQAILQTCDALRDEILPTLGIRLEDGGTDQPSMWNSEDPKVLMQEIAEKKEREKEQKRKKLANQKVTKEKEMNKIKDAMVDPKNLFKTEEYKEWDPETGLPTIMADGTAISGGQAKKKKKLLDKHTKAHKAIMAKTNNDPQAALDKLIQEIEELKLQMEG